MDAQYDYTDVRRYEREVLEAMKQAIATDRHDDTITIGRLALIVERLIDLIIDNRPQLR